jgi:hypothetical protein
MSLSDLYPTIRQLPRADKLRLMQLLIVDLAHEEDVPLLAADAEYPVWTLSMPSRRRKPLARC